MSGLVRSAHRIIQGCVKNTSLASALVSRTQAPVKRDFTRGIWHMSCSSRVGGPASTGLLHNHSNTCSCGCGLKALHTKGIFTYILRLYLLHHANSSLFPPTLSLMTKLPHFLEDQETNSAVKSPKPLG